MIDLETATTRLYEDPSITEDLIDEEAQLLLGWAAARLPDLIAHAPDELTFDESFGALRQIVKGVNRLIGQQESIDTSLVFPRLIESTTRLALPFGEAQASAYHEAIATLSRLDALRYLIDQLTPKPLTLPSPEDTPDEPETTQTTL
ncbi:MAG: hypothetical protein MUF87_07960 [Anaerolineae bacterium]|jgi:hypothetical protein|nr:hypothetical protein [Anaerolineae bacterium]